MSKGLIWGAVVGDGHDLCLLVWDACIALMPQQQLMSRPLRLTLKGCPYVNIVFNQTTVDAPGIPAGSQDFGYSLGVLHHVPDTAAAIRSCVTLLKPGAPLLLYLYYAFDNRPVWFGL